MIAIYPMFTPGQQANSPAWACDYSNVDFLGSVGIISGFGLLLSRFVDLVGIIHVN